MAIYDKLLRLQKAVMGLTKDKKGNSYEYVSGDKVLGIVRPTMDELGLILISEVTDTSFQRIDYNTKTGPKSEMFCAIKMRFTWVDAETGEKVACDWASSGMNNWDKGYGSAVTYGERYFFLKFFHIATDKDDIAAPKTAEQEFSLQSAIAYINGLNTTEEMQNAWNYYSQWYGKDKEFIKAYNKKMQQINGTK